MKCPHKLVSGTLKDPIKNLNGIIAIGGAQINRKKGEVGITDCYA